MNYPSRRRAFSLVELLVVIGVIALLIAMLLPALAKSREGANRVKCLSQLRNVGQAFQLHANDHRGYYPVAGWHWEPIGNLADPKGLLDPEERRYSYYLDNGVKRPLPITAALAQALGYAVRTDSRANLEEDLELPALHKYFTCPSQETPLKGLSQRDGGTGWDAPTEYTSYVFNEALLGKRDFKADRPDPVMGNVTRVLRPSEVLLAMDGRPRNMTHDNFILAFDLNARTTFLEFYNVVMQDKTGFGKQTLDYWRHRHRMNVLFCDYHVDDLDMTDGTLESIGLSKGLYP